MQVYTLGKKRQKKPGREGRRAKGNYFLDFSTVLRKFQLNDGQSLSQSDPSEEAGILQVWAGLIPLPHSVISWEPPRQSTTSVPTWWWIAEHSSSSVGHLCALKEEVREMPFQGHHRFLFARLRSTCPKWEDHPLHGPHRPFFARGKFSKEKWGNQAPPLTLH